MIVGSLIVAVCLLFLGWTSEIVGAFTKDPEKVCVLHYHLELETDLMAGPKCHDRSCSSEYLCG